MGEAIKLNLPSTGIFELIHNVSMFLIMDDKDDLGRFTYYDRHEHWYQGKNSPHHPTPWHHWQIGAIGLLVSQIGALVSKGVEMYNDYKDVESGAINVDSELGDVFSDNTIALEEYQKEVSEIPEQMKGLPNKVISLDRSPLEVPELPSLIGLA